MEFERVPLFKRQQQGGVPAQFGVGQFADGNVEAVWISVFTFFIAWLLGLLLTPLITLLRGGRKTPTPSTSATGATEAGAASTTATGSPGEKGTSNWGSRLANFTRAARDSLLILLSIAVVNMFGHGATGVIHLWID